MCRGSGNVGDRHRICTACSGTFILSAGGTYDIHKRVRQPEHAAGDQTDLSGTGGADTCRNLCNRCPDRVLPECQTAETAAGADGIGRGPGHAVGYVSDFQGKFDNRQIDSLCITLIQAGESGQAVELFQDMGEQLKDLELTALRHQKSALDRSITFYQLGMLGATLGVILYACVGYMFRAAVKF